MRAERDGGQTGGPDRPLRRCPPTPASRFRVPSRGRAYAGQHRVGWLTSVISLVGRGALATQQCDAQAPACRTTGALAGNRTDMLCPGRAEGPELRVPPGHQPPPRAGLGHRGAGRGGAAGSREQAEWSALLWVTGAFQGWSVGGGGHTLHLLQDRPPLPGGWCLWAPAGTPDPGSELWGGGLSSSGKGDGEPAAPESKAREARGKSTAASEYRPLPPQCERALSAGYWPGQTTLC